jgi:hypothetical protein
MEPQKTIHYTHAVKPAVERDAGDAGVLATKSV